MSTLAAARADNFYFSKTYDPAKIKPRKSDTEERKPFVRVEGQHIYGKKIRYETPFHVRCYGCHNMIAKGVRFNAVQKMGTLLKPLSRTLLYHGDLRVLHEMPTVPHEDHRAYRPGKLRL